MSKEGYHIYQQRSEEAGSWSWFTAASKTLGTYGATLVVVTDNVQEALAYFHQHLRPLLVADLPRNGKI